MKKTIVLALCVAAAVSAREVKFGVKSFELPGTLSFPAGNGPHPAVVLVHGSGPNDRDETLGPNKPFRDLADGLNSRGIAVFRYDKRTRVHAARGLRTVDDEVVTDACEALQYLQKQPDIDGKRVWVLGHSLGAYLVPRIVAKCGPSLAGAVVVAGPVRSLMEIIKEQLTSQNPLADPTPGLEQLKRAAPPSYWQDLEGYNPAAMAAKQTVPLLILQGGRDANVPAKELDLWKAALKDRKDVQFRSYPNLNHALIAGDGPVELTDVLKPGHVSQAVVQDIAAWMLGAAAAEPKAIRIGIVGTDTSHVPAFTRMLNDPTSPEFIPGAKVVAALKAGSQDVESSRTRVDNFAKEIESKYGVEIVADIQTLLSKVDAVLIENVDGRAHLQHARAVIAAKKPFFVDKPLASTLADAKEIARLAAAANVKWFSSSSLRFSDFVADLRSKDNIGAVAWSPGSFEEHHALDLSWYGIHGIETLYTVMGGPGCEEVTRTAAAEMDEISCKWKDGRIGSVRVMRPKASYGAVVFRSTGAAVASPADAKVSYVPLVREIVRFFRTGEAPVTPQETLEIVEFMDAAQRSKQDGGKPTRLLH